MLLATEPMVDGLLASMYKPLEYQKKAFKHFLSPSTSVNIDQFRNSQCGTQFKTLSIVPKTKIFWRENQRASMTNSSVNKCNSEIVK